MTDAPQGLVAALARCQAKFPAIVKSHENKHFGSQFADVADVLAAVRPVLAAEGVFVSQFTEITDEVVLVTALACEGPDGVERIQSCFPLAVQGLTAQQVGSLLTYHRRYQLCALLGVHPVGDDDDGNLAATAQQAAPASNTTSTAVLPLDWRTRPLAQMTFAELRMVAVELGHAFSGGSKSELIRQLEPLVRAASGGEPFEVRHNEHDDGDTPREAAQRAARVAAGTEQPETIPFSPVIAGAGSVRKAVNSSMKAD